MAIVKAGSGPARVYPVMAPELTPQTLAASLPDIIVHRVSEAAHYTLSETGARLYDSRITFECRAQSFTAADALGEQIKIAIEGRAFTFAGRTCTFFKAESDFSDFSEDRSIFRRMMDFMGHWSR